MKTDQGLSERARAVIASMCEEDAPLLLAAPELLRVVAELVAWVEKGGRFPRESALMGDSDEETIGHAAVAAWAKATGGL